jgi:predicted RNase H-like nuclease (RuvC/YqgF family)
MHFKSKQKKSDIDYKLEKIEQEIKKLEKEVRSVSTEYTAKNHSQNKLLQKRTKSADSLSVNNQTAFSAEDALNSHSDFTNRKRFADYFMAGHFDHLKKPKQDTRIVRNKAIIMMGLFVIALFWFVYVLQNY